LIGALIDVNNKKWMSARTLRNRIKVSEIRDMERFQNKIKKSLPPS